MEGNFLNLLRNAHKSLQQASSWLVRHSELSHQDEGDGQDVPAPQRRSTRPWKSQPAQEQNSMEKMKEKVCGL